jgi:hypothetical protein
LAVGVFQKKIKYLIININFRVLVHLELLTWAWHSYNPGLSSLGSLAFLSIFPCHSTCQHTIPISLSFFDIGAFNMKESSRGTAHRKKGKAHSVSATAKMAAPVM